MKFIRSHFEFEDGHSSDGITLWLAPMVQKYLPLTRDRLMLVEKFAPELFAWFNEAQYDEELNIPFPGEEA